eukprot:jgi/Ulvmu1/12874/UM098_0062.1
MRQSSDVAAPPTRTKQTMAKADYLAKYYSAEGASRHDVKPTKMKKKKKRRRNETQPSHVRVVDEDVGWPVHTGSPTLGKPVDGDESDDGPVVENAAEVHHQLQLLQGQAKFSSQWEAEEAPTRPTRRHESDDDSPPRRRARHDSDDESPPRLSPNGRGMNIAEEIQNRNDVSGSHRSKALVKRAADVPQSHHHDSDDDSPPCRQRAAPRAGRHESDNVSPSRGPHPRGWSSGAVVDNHGGGKSHQHDSDDESPPRRNQPDAAHGGHVDRRPAQARSARHDSDDGSPPRQGAATSVRPASHTRAAPGHRMPEEECGSESSHGRKDAKDDRQRAMHMKNTGASRHGQRAAATGGLVESHVMAKQIQQKKHEDRQRVLEMDPSKSGRGAVSTFRLDGTIVSKEQYEEAMAARQPKRHPKYLEEDVEWKGGLAQRRAAEAQKQALEQEGRKRFHREFDEDADASMQQELRMDDPMASYFTFKQRTQHISAEGGLVDTHTAELSHASGFKVPQTVPAHSWIKRGVQPLPNRYNIKPGRHWDGVSRGNGFERKFVFQYQHNRAERERDRYVLAEDL